MVYLASIFILICGYYTFTYGVTIYIKHKNKLGGFAVITLAIISSILTIAVAFMKNL